MTDYTDGLNEQQKQAVEHNEGTLIILAGAGCGKTKVLTSRIANLIKSGVSAYEILAVTFTNKAAKEMKERLSKWLGEECVKRMWVGTFHGIAGRILRSDIDKYISKDGQKYDKSFVIYDDSDSKTLIKNSLKKLNMDEKIYPVKQLRQVISDAKNRMISSYSFASRARTYRDEQYSRVYTEYQSQLSLNNAVDFDDMLLMACELLKNNPEVREKYHKRFKHILVDEFQDTNLAQYNFIKSIYTNDDPMYESKKRSLCTVGDIDQSIYSWRGADYKILLNMQANFPDAKMIKLEQNYRSTDVILQAANAIIKNNIDRTEKNLYSNLGKGELIEVYEAMSEDEEANYIVKTVKNLQDQYKLSECCVLYRTNSQSRKIEDACIYYSLPYKIIGGQKFYDRKEIKDIIAYLKFIVNPSDSQSLARIINFPKRSLGETTFKKLQTISSSSVIPISDVLAEIENYSEFSAGTRTKLRNFYNLIIHLREKMADMQLPEYISFLIDETSFIQGLKDTEDEVTAEAKIDNLQEFINVAREFEPTESNDYTSVLGEFLSQISLVSDIDSFEEDNSLTLMTLHSAKGLEFDVVFLAGLDDGIFPSIRNTEAQYKSAEDLEEERRLMYVGVTRARKRLFITHAEHRKKWGKEQFYEPSRFINEIPVNLTSYDESLKQNTDTVHLKNFSYKPQKPKSSPYVSFNSGKLAPQTTFGKNFVAPQKRVIINKKNDANVSRISNEEKVKKILEDNPIKRKIEAARAKAEQKPVFTMQTATDLKAGDRVFHPQFGVGYMEEVKTVAGTTLYIVEFNKSGKKSFDSTFSNLKKF